MTRFRREMNSSNRRDSGFGFRSQADFPEILVTEIRLTSHGFAHPAIWPGRAAVRVK